MSKPPRKILRIVSAAPAAAAGKLAAAELKLRDRVLEMLSDAEVASVSSAETASRLKKGEQYIDLNRLDLGVREADGAIVPMGRVLPRGAVQDKTWAEILAQLAAKPPAPATAASHN